MCGYSTFLPHVPPICPSLSLPLLSHFSHGVVMLNALHEKCAARQLVSM